SGEDRKEKGEGEDGGVDRGVLDTRQVGGLQEHEEADARESDQQTEHATQKREDNALGDDLADKAADGSAESGTNGDFAASRGRACKLKTGEINAGDEQNDCNSGEDEKEFEADIAHDGFAKGNQPAMEVAVALGILRSEPCVDALHFALGLRKRNGGLEAC